MQWSEIDHYYNRFNASVIFQPHETDIPQRYDGVVICNGPNSAAFLEHVHGKKFVKPPMNARVVLHWPVIPGGWGVNTIKE